MEKLTVAKLSKKSRLSLKLFTKGCHHMLQRTEHFRILISMSCDTKPHSTVIRFTCFEGSCCVHLVHIVTFYVLFTCKCVLPPGVNPIAVNKYININIHTHRTVGTCLSGYTYSRPTYNSEDHIRNILSFETSNLVQI
jgi:hypothetical protein